ncbi:hypothetical protein BGAL_0473g00010 [Botrytis galanthina]|uniref:Uncharacterized protein n=1 Tax=Botrytis galanthina TaxID=278940 RepID=A0A4S8QPF2_9HELO|nr:hypothetical protein BGAL_0473g00010 [Botrytis galanthina]
MTSSPLKVELKSAVDGFPGGFQKIAINDNSGGKMEISFHRTIRVPDDGKNYQLPPDLGKFPIFSINDYAEKLPLDIVRKGGVFVPIWQREALWTKFNAYGTSRFAVKVFVGGINAVSEESRNFETIPMEPIAGSDRKQDYLVVPGQEWLDGVVRTNGTVMQFVAVPTGSGYSVEAQIAGVDKIAGLQFEIIPFRVLQISIDFDPRDESYVPLFDNFVALCRYISANLPNLESAILWLTITEDDFQEILKFPMRFSWVRASRELPVEKVDICPLLIKSGESDAARKKRLRRSISGRDDFFWDHHHARLGMKSLFLNDVNNERGLITHILTPGSKLWGYTDDIDDDNFISLQYMESWLSYTDDIADDAYLSIQLMEGWNKKPLKSPRFRRIKKFHKLLRLQRYQLPRQTPPNQLVPQQNIRRSEQAAFRNLLPVDGWPRSIWYQMKL